MMYVFYFPYYSEYMDAEEKHSIYPTRESRKHLEVLYNKYVDSVRPVTKEIEKNLCKDNCPWWPLKKTYYGGNYDDCFEFSSLEEAREQASVELAESLCPW